MISDHEDDNNPSYSLVDSFINSHCNNCEEACTAIGKLLGYNDDIIKNELQTNNNHYALLKKYLSFLRRKSTWEAALAKKIDENTGGDEQAIKVMNDTKLIVGIQENDTYKYFTSRLEVKFNYGIKYRLAKRQSIENYEEFDPDIKENDLNELSQKLSTDEYLKNHPDDIIAMIGNIITAIDKLRTLRDKKNHYNSTDKISQKILDEKESVCNNNIKIYKGILNDLVILLSQSEINEKIILDLSNTVQNAFNQHIYHRAESIKQLCIKHKPKEYKNYIQNKEVSKFNADIFSAFNSYANNIHSTDPIEAQLKFLESLINEIKAINPESNDDQKFHDAILNDLQNTKKSILSEWGIYLTKDKSNLGRFGYVNPAFYLQFENNFNTASTEIAKNITEKELKTEFKEIFKKDLKKIQKKKISILKKFTSTVIETTSSIIYGGPQNNQADSLDSIDNILTQASNQLEIIKTQLENPSPDHNIVNNINSILKIYNDALYGDQNIQSNKEGFKLLSQKLAETEGFIKRNRAMFAFLSSLDVDASKKLYSNTFVATHQQLAKQTKNKLNTWGMTILQKITNPPDYDREAIALINQLESLDQAWDEKSFIDYLNKMKTLIRRIRQDQEGRYLKKQANILEQLCYDMIYHHVNQSNNNCLALKFTSEQLEKIKVIVVNIQGNIKVKTNNKTLDILQDLDKKISYLNSKNEGLLSESEKTNYITDDYRAEDGSIIKEARYFEVFTNHFTVKMTGDTITDFAISSGRITTKLSPAATLVGGGIGIANSFLPGTSSITDPIIQSIDSFDQKRDANRTIEGIGPLDDWLPLLKTISERLLILFKPQIAAMVNEKDVKDFAKFCEGRIFAALHENPLPEWVKQLNQVKSAYTDEVNEENKKEIEKKLKDERMIRFCIAAVFLKQTPAPFGGNHYHANINTVKESGIRGTLTFQKLVSYAGFLILNNKEPEVYPEVYLTNPELVLKKKKKKASDGSSKRTRLQKYGFLDGSDDPLFYKWLATKIGRHEISEDVLSQLPLTDTIFNQNNAKELVDAKKKELQRNRNVPKTNK